MKDGNKTKHSELMHFYDKVILIFLLKILL